MFEQLYRTHVSRIYTFGLKFFEQNKTAAEELTKRVFVSAFEQINSYSENETFILWLRIIAINEVRKDDIKKSAEKHEAGKVEEAIFSLPIEEKIVFILHDVDKLQNEEITLITNNSIENINTVLGNARKLLMDKLNIKRLDDLDSKVMFLPRKIEPRPEIWDVIFKAINKTEVEEPQSPESAGKKLLGFFKKKN